VAHRHLSPLRRSLFLPTLHCGWLESCLQFTVYSLQCSTYSTIVVSRLTPHVTRRHLRKTPIRYSASPQTETSRTFPLQELSLPRALYKQVNFTDSRIAYMDVLTFVKQFFKLFLWHTVTHLSLRHHQPIHPCRNVSNGNLQRELHILRFGSDMG
jgi:hypothetical protein